QRNLKKVGVAVVCLLLFAVTFGSKENGIVIHPQIGALILPCRQLAALFGLQINSPDSSNITIFVLVALADNKCRFGCIWTQLQIGQKAKIDKLIQANWFHRCLHSFYIISKNDISLDVFFI